MGQHGVQALTYAELGAWAQLTDRNIQPHEVDAMLDLDVTVRLTMAG